MSGSENDRLAGSESYLENGRIRWDWLAGTAIGSLILAWATGFADVVFATYTGVARMITGIFAFFREALVQLIRIPIPGVQAGFDAARQELLGLELGPLTFVAGVGFVVAWFWLLSIALDRLEVR
jgi:hypothetical protein